MGILIGFIRQYQAWDVASRVSFAMAFVLFWLMLALFSFGPLAIRDYALVGVVGLLLGMQLIVLWGNRTMVTPYTKAQRHFMIGNLDAAREVLEADILQRQKSGKKLDADSLTLLGNAYRQLGNLNKSQQLLIDALKISPKSHFSHYGLGRTLLSQGNYTAAAEHIEQSLSLGAPTVVLFDLGHAYMRLEKQEEATVALKQALQETDEAHRQLMATYWLYELGVGERPEQNLRDAGLPYWQQESQMFAETLYGQQLEREISYLMYL